MGASLDSFHSTVPACSVFFPPFQPHLPLPPYWILINSTSKTSKPYGGLCPL